MGNTATKPITTIKARCQIDRPDKADYSDSKVIVRFKRINSTTTRTAIEIKKTDLTAVFKG